MEQPDEEWRRQRQRRARRRRFIAAAIALLVALALVVPSVAALLPPARGAESARPGASVVQAPLTQESAAPASGEGPIVLIGMTGVSWTDVTGVSTPALWQVGTEMSGGNLVVRSQRSSACPADGWLAVSAGRRSADVPLEQHGACRLLRSPSPGSAVPGWEDYLASAQAASYDASPGTLGSALAQAGRTARGIGPGAAIALADPDGMPVGTVVSRPSTSDQLSSRVHAALAEEPDVLVVDVGDVRDPGRPLVPVLPSEEPTEVPAEQPADDSVLAELGGGDDSGSLLDRIWEPSRESLVIAVDARVRAVLEAVREDAPDATVLVASVADPGTRAGLRLVAAGRPGVQGAQAAGLLTSNSTRQTGLVQTFDLTATVLDRLGIDPPAGAAGAPIVTAPGTTDGSGTGAERISHLAGETLHAAAVPRAAPTFTLVLIVANLLVYALVTVGLNRKVLDRVAHLVRPSGERRGAGSDTAASVGSRAVRPRRIEAALRALRALATTIAALPISATLANLLPWYRAEHTGLALAVAIAGWSVLIAAGALLGPWRRWLLGPMGFVATVTWVVLAVDVATGATLQVSNVLGIQPQVGARYYGFNNQTFALFATASLLVAMCVAEQLVRAGRRRLAAVLVLFIGVVSVLLNGLPSIGADFGGPPATVPGFLVLAILTAGHRLTVKRVALVLLAAVTVVGGFLLADWLRPPAQRTHLGAFVQTVLDGGLWDVVGRKLSSNLSLLFGTPLTFLVIGGIVVVLVVLSRPLRAEREDDAHARASAAYGWLTGGPSILRLDRSAVMLRPGLVAITLTLLIGFALNDSGILVPALGIALLVPLLIAVLATWLLRQRRARAAGPLAGATAADQAEASERVQAR